MAGRSKTSATVGKPGKAGTPKQATGIRTLEGEPGAGRGNVAVVVAKFNSAITDRLLAGAVDCLLAHGLKPSAITVAKVPGAVEIPLAAKRLAASRKYAAVVALGCVIRGDTTHYDYVCAIAAQGVLEAGLATGVPVIFGVLTTENLEQALARAGAYPGSEPAAGGGSGAGEGDNKGWDAALAALEMADLLGKIR